VLEDVDRKCVLTFYDLFFPPYYLQRFALDCLERFASIAPGNPAVIARQIVRDLSDEMEVRVRNPEMDAGQQGLRDLHIAGDLWHEVSFQGATHCFLRALHLLCTYRFTSRTLAEMKRKDARRLPDSPSDAADKLIQLRNLRSGLDLGLKVMTLTFAISPRSLIGVLLLVHLGLDVSVLQHASPGEMTALVGLLTCKHWSVEEMGITQQEADNLDFVVNCMIPAVERVAGVSLCRRGGGGGGCTNARPESMTCSLRIIVVGNLRQAAMGKVQLDPALSDLCVYQENDKDFDFSLQIKGSHGEQVFVSMPPAYLIDANYRFNKTDKFSSDKSKAVITTSSSNTENKTQQQEQQREVGGGRVVEIIQIQNRKVHLQWDLHNISVGVRAIEQADFDKWHAYTLHWCYDNITSDAEDGYTTQPVPLPLSPEEKVVSGSLGSGGGGRFVDASMWALLNPYTAFWAIVTNQPDMETLWSKYHPDKVCVLSREAIEKKGEYDSAWCMPFHSLKEKKEFDEVGGV
jgi:hypothetical protein